MIKLVGYEQRLSALGFAIPMTLGTDILLASLPPSYNGFIMNYNMNGLDKTTNELFAMLKDRGSIYAKGSRPYDDGNHGHWKRNCKKYLRDMKNGLITVCINKLYEVNRQFHYFTFIGLFDTISIALVLHLDTVNYQNSKEKSE